jgi:septal ring factor EnvC (AmiA/AmiB activator)
MKWILFITILFSGFLLSSCSNRELNTLKHNNKQLRIKSKMLTTKNDELERKRQNLTNRNYQLERTKKQLQKKVQSLSDQNAELSKKLLLLRVRMNAR